MKKTLSILVITFTTSAFANELGNRALSFVPGGTIQTQKSDEVKIKTKQGTLVEIDFTRTGELEDASGDMAEKDEFNPGKEMKSLSEVVSEVKKQGYLLKGDWSYDKDLLNSWHYELEAMHEGKEVEIKVDAKTAKILNVEIDD